MAVKIKNEADYQQLLNNLASKKPAPELLGESGQLPQKAPKKQKKTDLVLNKDDMEVISPSKRLGVKETPIISSLRTCSIDAECSETHVTLAFKGARMFTLNEILAILQYRSYIIFSYKKQWQTLVHNGLRILGNKKPHFDGPCKITLFRQAKKKVDRDSLMVMFKYIIDALKDEPKTGLAGIFPDDNPDIVYSDEKIQRIDKNVPIIGIKIERIFPQPEATEKSVLDLFDAPPQSLRDEPEPIKIKKKRERKTPSNGSDGAEMSKNPSN